jgi:hypothetical protein
MDRYSDCNTSEESSKVNDMISVASRIVGREGITAVHVVSRQRPTYDEVLRYRQQATRRDLEFKVDASSVSFRAHRQADVGESAEAAGEDWRSRMRYATPRAASTTLHHGWSNMVNAVLPGLDRLRLQVQAWEAELGAMSEGTR